MKRIYKLTGAALAAVLSAAMIFSSFAGTNNGTDEAYRAPEMVLMDGTVLSVENGRLHMNRDFGNGNGSEEVVVTISEDTKVLEGENGYPVPLENLEKGEAIRVYTSPAMTMSLPPITNGLMVICDVPADAGFPVYTKVKSMVRNEDGSYTLTTADGTSYLENSSTTILPYLTRNLVREEDLVEGTPILVWPHDFGEKQFAAKIVVFQGENGYGSPAGESVLNGWKETDEGWYFYENGELKTGWLYEGEDWYFLSPETGLMQTGFITLDGRTYFLKEDGRMMTKAAVFVPDENGALHIQK